MNVNLARVVQDVDVRMRRAQRNLQNRILRELETTFTPSGAVAAKWVFNSFAPVLQVFLLHCCCWLLLCTAKDAVIVDSIRIIRSSFR